MNDHTNRMNHSLSSQDVDENEEIPYFLQDKPKRDRDDWFSGRRAMAYSTRQKMRRSFLRQAFNHNLLTEWATGHEGMPPWLQTDELNTAIFEVKAKAGREIMRLSLEHLDSDIKEHNQTSAQSLAKAESSLTPTEETASRAILKEHMDYISDPIRKSLADKREYLRRNQPSVSDLISMRNRERLFPKKSNPPPQKKRPVSAAQGKPPAKRQRDGDYQAQGQAVAIQGGDDDAGNRQQRPYPDHSRGGGYHHYRGNRNRNHGHSRDQDFPQPRRDQGDARQPAATAEPRYRRDDNPPRRGDKKRGQTKSRRPRKK